MTSPFDHPWLGALFGDAEAQAIWSPERQLDHMLAFEIALARALEATGAVPEPLGQVAAKAIGAAKLDMARLAEDTSRDGLPVPGLIKQLRSAAGEASPAVHTGATSQDVLDTALSLTLRDHTTLLERRLADLSGALEELATAFGQKRLMGRTRMQDALEISVAHRIAAWASPLKGHISALADARAGVERLQLAGAVGDGAAFGDRRGAIAAHMQAELGLGFDGTWHTDRSALVSYAGLLSLISGTLGKVGQDIALMAQSGPDHIVLSGGGGSSAMPHKSNPVLAELLVTLARFNAAQLSGMHQALVHEQERSGAAWALEWMILPGMAVTAARSLSAAQSLCAQIESLGRTPI